MTDLRGEDLLRLDALSDGAVEAVLSRADDLEPAGARTGARGGVDDGVPAGGDVLDGVVLGMLFQKRSTRTRVSFEAGVDRLGGDAVFLSSDDVQLGRGETIADTARALARYCDVLMARVYDHGDVEELAAHSDVPVVNGLSDFNHPCQALADLRTIREERGALDDVAVAWVGDGNNVCHSLLQATARFGADVRVASPADHGPDPEVVAAAREDAAASDGSVDVGTEPEAAVDGADVVYTDSWVSMGDDDKDLAQFEPFRVDEDLMAGAADDAVFMHCLPAHRGQEVTDAVMDGPRSVVWRQAENRMHVQNALITSLLGRNP